MIRYYFSKPNVSLSNANTLMTNAEFFLCFSSDVWMMKFSINNIHAM